MAKFNVGDEIYSEKNPFVKYRVVQVDIPKMNKDPEYILEDIWSRGKGKQYRMPISRVDKWGVLLNESKPKEQLVVMNYVTGDVDIYNVDSNADIDEEYLSKLGYRTCDCHWMFCQNGVNVNYEDKVLV